MVFVKKSHILSRVFISQLHQKKKFFDIPDRKECFLHQKSAALKKVQKSKFFKGVGPWFLSKNRIFYQGCSFRIIDQKRSFFDILDRKQ